jgi:hypothetical protein
MRGAYMVVQEGLPGDSRNTALKYVVVCLCFGLVLMIGPFINDSFSFSRIPFQVMLFLLCYGACCLGGNIPRHRLMLIFVACYYLIFGMADFLDILGVNDEFLLGANRYLKSPNVIMTKSDWVVITGILSFIFGYYVVSRRYANRKSGVFAEDWNPKLILAMGFVFWVSGFMVIVVYDMTVTPMHIPRTVLGLPIGIASNLKLFCYLGILMISYLAIKGYRPMILRPLLFLIIILQFLFGFIADSKETSYFAPTLLICGMFYIRGTINKKFIAIALLTFIPYFLLFNIYRGSVLQATDLNRKKAVASFDKNASRVLEAASKQTNVVGKSLGALKQRIDGKVYIDIIVNGTDSGRVQFLDGKTLMYVLTAFIPRMFWPEKPDMSTGQMFNKAFQLSESRFTFVPTTQLGELYWNFGFTGVIAGMVCIGMIFGLLSSMLGGGGEMTLMRFLLLLLATYFLAVRFEVNLALQYPIFVRLLVLLTIIHTIVGFLGFHQRIDKKTTLVA